MLIQQYYLNEKNEMFKIGDYVHDDLDEYIITKFINHHYKNNKKELYLLVNLQHSKYKTKNFSLSVDLLGTVYKK